MKLLFTKDSLRRKIASDPDDEPSAGNMPRFWIDHGVIHDRETGQHVAAQFEDDWQERLLALLNELAMTPASNTRIGKP